MDAQLKRGLLDMCVLKVLVKKDSYGYEIISLLENTVKIAEATLYPILKRLEKQGLVETYNIEYNSRLRKYYKITSEGVTRLESFKEDYKELDKIYRFILEDK